MTSEIEELNSLHAKTTQGEWGNSIPKRSGLEHVYLNSGEIMLADCRREPPRNECEANAAWISAIHNAWPEIAISIKKMAAGLRAVQELIDQSDGVIGLHLNGDPALWEDLGPGGLLKSWLKDFDVAYEVAESLNPCGKADNE